MIISFSKMYFQTNMIFHYYTVEMHFWKKYFFISNINEIHEISFGTLELLFSYMLLSRYFIVLVLFS